MDTQGWTYPLIRKLQNLYQKPKRYTTVRHGLQTNHKRLWQGKRMPVTLRINSTEGCCPWQQRALKSSQRECDGKRGTVRYRDICTAEDNKSRGILDFCTTTGWPHFLMN